jgi:hypothetical protein
MACRRWTDREEPDGWQTGKPRRQRRRPAAIRLSKTTPVHIAAKVELAKWRQNSDGACKDAVLMWSAASAAGPSWASWKARHGGTTAPDAMWSASRRAAPTEQAVDPSVATTARLATEEALAWQVAPPSTDPPRSLGTARGIPVAQKLALKRLDHPLVLHRRGTPRETQRPTQSSGAFSDGRAGVPTR